MVSRGRIGSARISAAGARAGLRRSLLFVLVGGAALLLSAACSEARAGGARGPGALGRSAAAADTSVTLPPERVGVGSGELRLSVELPAGYEVNEQAPSEIVLRSTGGAAVSFPGRTRFGAPGPRFPMSFPAVFAPGSGEVTVDLSVVYCRDKQASECLIRKARLVVPVTVDSAAPRGGGRPALRVDYRIR